MASLTTSIKLQPESGRFRAFTVIDGWQADPKAEDSDKPFVAGPIMLEKSPWAIVWSSERGGLSVGLRDCSSPESTPLEEALKATTETQGIEYIDRAGTFYLTIKGRGRWVLKVVEVA